MNDPTDAPAKLVKFGQGGDVVYLSGTSRISGYGTPERPHAANPAERNIPDGTPALDLREAVQTKEGFSWGFRGPIVDVDLPEGEAKPLQLTETDGPLAAGLSHNSEVFAALIALQTAKGKARGPLDSVSTAEYIAGWLRHGARVGHYEKGRIVWHE